MKWTITTGVWRTKRKSFSTVTDPSGNHVFSSRRFWPCVAYLDAMEITDYEIRPDADEFPSARPISVNRQEF